MLRKVVACFWLLGQKNNGGCLYWMGSIYLRPLKPRNLNHRHKLSGDFSRRGTQWIDPPKTHNTMPEQSSMICRFGGHYWINKWTAIQAKSLEFILRSTTYWFNSLGPSDAIWRWRSWSTLVQEMVCCLTAPSDYLNQCWLIISMVLWHSAEDIIIRRFKDTNQ